VCIPVGVAWLAVLSFFRDPLRRIPRKLPPGAMLSPADGTVSAVLEVEHHVAVGGPGTIVRIFLSVLNVHVNRSPCDGEVVRLDYAPGRHFDARTPESSILNESNLITVRLSSGETIGIRQVAGKIARRIVCPLRVGDRVVRGRRFGMIKFGSTTELILPRSAQPEVLVAPGDRVRGGVTILAMLGRRAGLQADAGGGSAATPAAVAGRAGAGSPATAAEART
jgi:phosphatidylserine decarboxylase